MRKDWPVKRHSQRKRGATDRPDLRSIGASPRPYRGFTRRLQAIDAMGRIGGYRFGTRVGVGRPELQVADEPVEIIEMDAQPPRG